MDNLVRGDRNTLKETYEVSEKMAKFIDWCYSLGEEEVRRLVREKIYSLKEEMSKLPKGMKNSSGESWDDRLEPNDGPDQFRHGGDCNLCRKAKYCSTQCRANKLLKHVSTKFLYDCYLENHPEELVKEAANGITPEEVLRKLGVEDAKVGTPNVEQPVS